MRPIKILKRSIRKSMTQKREESPLAFRQKCSAEICERLWTLVEENQAQVIHSYLPMGKEVNVLPVLEKALAKGLKVVVPKVLKKRTLQHLILSDLKDMEKGVMGTYHPANTIEYSGNYDLIIVPGLAFSQDGSRIGYGGGYYDIFLNDLASAIKIGVCYPFQILDEMPVEDHDVKLNKILF